MSEQLAAAEPYTTLFESTVSAVDGRGVRLDTSYFFAGCAGQPADRGRIGGVAVTDVTRDEGELVHVLDEEPSFGPGSQVLCRIDWDYRMYCMRAHTAGHVLFGAARQLLDDLDYRGLEIAPETIRIDFTTSSEVDDGTLVDLERLGNQVVWESRSVSWEVVPREDVLDDEAIAFDDASDHDPSSDDVRTVTVGDAADNGPSPWDVAVCDGTHVRNTREIGPIVLLDRSSDDESTRVEFAVGPPGIEQRVSEKRAALEASRELDTNVAGLPGAVVRLEREREALEDQVGVLATELVEASVAAAADDVFERDGETWVVAPVPGLDPNELAERVGDVAGTVADVVILVGTDPVCVVVGSAGETSASSVMGELTAEFGGGGSGSETVAQGGDIDATVEEVVAILA